MSWNSLKKPSIKVAISGATSASGVWMARAFTQAGYQTLALCSRNERDYSGLKNERLTWLKKCAQVYFGIRAQNEMAHWIREFSPTIWIHHHHPMENFRSPSYDFKKAVAEAITPLPKIVESLKSTCKRIIFSGTYFEPLEGGAGGEGSYGRSKELAGLELQKLAFQSGISFSKVVIPDLTGPFENEDRLIPQILRTANEKKAFSLFTPDQYADQG